MMENESLTGLEIAIIGMAGRFPAAANIDEYWENIKNGIECIPFFSEEELEKAGISPELYNRPDYVKSNGGIVEGVEYFDADFFGYTPTEAELLDPQVRLFHECCWEALEDAGYDPGAYKGLIGLYGGAEDNNTWREKVLLSTKEGGAKQTRILLSSKDFVTARVSYKLDLKGPVFALITGCSTALTSIHLASRSLIGGECDMALAGGAYVHLSPLPGRIYQEGTLESKDGHLRAFDSRASGTIFGSGAGIVVLKILEDALADNDHIYAVIKGTAVNCDGNRKVNFTAPSVKGQAEAIKAAYQTAGVEMTTIGYLETHGTGTVLGDPIEINALKQAFNTGSGWKCPIGSAKTNIGHLDVAAGAAGLIKTALILKHKLIPPSLHFESPNPKLELEKTPFYVNTQLTELKSNGGPRRAAVSSFGFGGTNVHAILEEAPAVSGSVGQWVSESPGKSSEGTGGLAPLANRQHQLILLSAKTPTALDKMTQNLIEYFKNNLLNHGNHENPVNPGQNPGLTLADDAYTLQVGRQPFQYRRMCVCSNPADVIQVLPSSLQGEAQEDPPVVFMFSGQGSQYVNMGLGIYRSEPVFRQHMGHGFDILKSLTGKDFKAIFYPGLDTVDMDDIQEQMNDAHNSGPIKLIFEYSLGKLLIHWGIRPHAVMGHSFGEYTAACIAGVFSLRDALELALLRGELMLRTPPGGMMSIPLGQEQLAPYLKIHPHLSLAAANSSSLCFVSGPSAALEDIEKNLLEKGIESMHINFPRAAHSHMMKSITGEFEKKVKTIKLQDPTIPFISGLTGDWLSPGQITEPAYWAKHLEKPVQFCRGIEKLLKEPGCIFVQVGPDKGLPLFVNRHRHFKPGTLVTNLVRHKKDNVLDMVYLLQQVGALWLHGVKIDWSAFYAGGQRQRVSLPTYPFERKRYWIDIDISAVVSDFFSRDRLKKRKNISHWFYTSSWKRAPLVPASTAGTHETTPCLIFTDTGELGSRFAGKLEEKGQAVITVKPGKGFKKENPQFYHINPTDSSDYDRLFKALKTQKKIPRLLIHFWNVTGTRAPDLTAAALETTLDLGLYSLLHIVQSLGRLGINEEMHLEVVTDNMQSVIGEEMLYPAKAASLGAVWVIPQEYPNITCHTVDILLPEPGGPQEEKLLQQLLAIIAWGGPDKTNPVMALRGNRSWIQTYEPTPIEKPQGPPSRLRQGGIYLITGGLGGIGYVLAEHLVKTVKARLILTGRSQLPPRHQWQQWLDTHPEEDRVSQRIKKVIDLEKLGAEVLVLSADSADEKQMQDVVTRAMQHFGQVNGIIHTAGLVDYYGVIQKRTREMTENILAPKVKGTMILDQLTRDMALDFFVVCSSIASLIPGFGEVGYAAANIFIDAFAHYKNLTGKPFFTAVNWDTWQEVGAAVESVNKQKQAGKTSYIRLEDGIRPSEGWEVFTMILENPNPQVVVSTKDLDRLLKQYRQAKTEAKAAPGEMAEAAVTASKRSLRPRPKLSTPYVAPASPTQQTLVEIWQNYFGIDRVGIEDDFFELGGDSLMATIMSARIHKRMDIRIPLSEIFQGPTVELLSQYIKSQEEEEFESIPLVEKKEYYPLSPAQKRLFVLQQMEPGLISYNSPDFFILEGKLDKDRLNQALDKMIQRHESLRTTFEIMEGEPVQRVADHIDSEVEYYTAGEEEARQIVKDFVRIFDLRSAPLLRVGLIHLHTPTALRGHPSQEGRAQNYIYMFDMHHIITDGISLEIFADEFLAMYEGRQLPPLPIRYKDFARWQIHLLESEAIKKQEEYWLKEFAGEIPILELPTDYPRPEKQSFEGRKFQVQLNPGDTQGLNRLSREQDVTLYMTTLAVIKVLFSRLSSQETIIMGTITAGRQHEDLQHIIGMFVNTLALKSHPAGDKTFSQYLQELKQMSLAAFENQDYPFEELVSKLNLDRYMNRNPLFDVMFSFQNFEAPPLETQQSPPEAKSTAQLRKKPYTAEDLASRFDITLFVRENPDNILFNWEYCTKLFKQGTIERFSNYIKKIVSTILDNPGIPLGKIEIITGEEKQRLLYEFNHTEVPYSTGKTLHQLFTQQAQRTPDQIALVGNPGKKYRTHMTYISYRQLHEKSGGLARILAEKGVKPDTIVGLVLERSPDMIVGILAVLKAGGAYLPIDPDYPQERVDFMLKDSNAQVLVVDSNSSASRLSFAPKAFVNLSEGHHLNFPASPLPSLPASLSTSLAYTIYTSGTTGKPKGVMIEHGNVVRLLFNQQFQFDFNERDTWTLFHSYAFDFSVWEMYGALLYGGQLVVVPRMTARDPQGFLQVLTTHCVTVLNQTPSAFYNLMAEALGNKNRKDLKLRYVIFGGEALQPGKLAAWQEKYPDTLLVNMFGITETTVHVTYREIGREEIASGISDIGKPIPTLSIYVMDSYGLLLPQGTRGELCVGGKGVARGYLNRPELTAEKFDQDLWDLQDYQDEKKEIKKTIKTYKQKNNQKLLQGSPDVSRDGFLEKSPPGRRRRSIYKSGDLARIMNDGNLEYLGRIDHQVQLRGFRVELGEIQHQLLKHREIRDAVVMDRSDSDGSHFLCAYIVPEAPDSTAAPDTPALKEYLAARLPDYMVPNYFVRLEEIPLTPNGKVNRKALPHPERRAEGEYIAPRTEKEQAVAKIWEEVLNLKSIGIDHNFFNLGGDSIKAIRLIGTLNTRLNSHFKIPDLYTHGTIRQLITLIDRFETFDRSTVYQRITADIKILKNKIFTENPSLADAVEDVYPMSDIEKGIVFYYLKHLGTGIYHDQFVYPIRYQKFHRERFEKALSLMIEKHPILRTAFNMEDYDKPVQLVYKKVNLPVTYEDLTQLSFIQKRERIVHLLEQDRRNPFDASVPPLWRMVLLALGSDSLCLLFIFHHAVLDGWSAASLMTEMHNTYLELKPNPTYVPPKLKLSYKDTVIEELIQKQNPHNLVYWKGELVGCQRLEFSETIKSKGELEPMKITRYNAGTGLVQQLHQVAARHRTSLKNLCFGAYALIMNMFAYEDDIVVGCVTNNRPGLEDGDKIVGCFLNTVPVRLKIPRGITWKDYTRHVEQKMQEVKKHEGLSLFEIALGVGEKSKDRNPFFDTLFNFTDFHIFSEVNPQFWQLPDEEMSQQINTNKEPLVDNDFQDTNTLFDFEVDITFGNMLVRPKYNTSAISEEMVEKCIGYFFTILNKYIHQPRGTIRNDEILSKEEKEKVLYRFNDTRAPYLKEKTLHRLVEEQVKQTPNRLAVIESDGVCQFSYRELNERANQLAHGLRQRGIKPGEFTAVVMERSIPMVVAVMGVLKAGGAYVPMEPYLPELRIQKLLESLGTACAITTPSTHDKIETLGWHLPHLNHILCLSDPGSIQDIGGPGEKPKENPSSAADAEDTAYVIFTSGSTGMPKGVVETHRPVVNVIEWVNRTFRVGPPDKLLFVASLAFDLSVYDIFGILASGASLRVTAAKDIKDPRKLLDIIMTEGITFWDSAPAALQQVVPFLHEVKDYSTRGRMRLVFLSGDWIPVAMPDELRKAFTGVRVISLGGATEATIWSNYYPIDGVNPSWPSIPYGKPIQNAKYYILDRSLEICPIRIPGDLYIGGECLASGYINEVELTAEKFILAHSSWLMADRVVKQVTDQYPMSYQLSTMNYIYKTGDIARWFDDGNIQFLGRKDHQVKIRGFRVELGEIEAQLLNHQLISDGVVVDRQDASGSKYLCAYYILKDPEAGIDKAGLKEHMAGELPEYMIPAYFIPIDKIPLTANGKLDRKGLPQPEGTIMVKRHYAVPVNKIQKTLVQIWSQLLFGRNSASLETPIGIDDDFFELGGHSLNATIAASRIHKELNVKIPLAEIFNSPTIRELSGKINQLSEERFSPIEPVEKKEYYVLSSAQRRLYFLQQMESENISYNIQEAVLMEGEIDIRRLEKTFLELIQRHETLRTSFEMVSGDIVQRIHGEAAFENELCVTPEAIMPAFVRPFDLSRAPLLRVGLIRPTFPPSALRSSPSPAHEGENSTNKYILMVDMHHIISDGVSHALLIRDFTTLYSGKPLSPIRIHYKDYSLWQTGEKQKQIIKRQEAYWLKEFEADVPVLDLPIDYPRPMIQNFQGRSLQFEIGPRETAALKQLAAEQKATLFMVLLAVYNVLLAKICNQEDIVVGTPIAGRNHADLDKIIGMFVNTLVLRNHPTGEKSFIGFLHEAKDKCLRAFENQDYLFEDLVEKAAVHRDTSRNPLFDVMLVLQNLVIDTNNAPSQLSGMELKPYDYVANISQFDLTLNASEMADKVLVKVEYCTKLFQEKTMLRIIGYLKKVVTSVITGSWKSLSEINLLSDEEKKQVLFDFNDTDTSYPAHKTTHELFAEQVKRVPHHIALLGKEKEGKDKRLRGKKQRESFGGNILLTYKELNEKASQLAFRLQEKGAQPDAIVAIMAGRSLEMIIGILAILKSGGAYLPIDPEYPQDRIDYMLNDSNAGILVTTSIQQVKVKAKVINLTSPSDPPEATPSTLTCQVSPANLAYIIYTSGTTGKPKGTLIEHGNVVRLMFNDKFQFDFSKTDVWTLFHSFCFDFSVWEMYGALLYGAKLVVIPKIVARDPEKYLKQLKEQCVTVLNQTPSAFYHLIDEELKCPDKYLNLKYVIFGGEALNPAKLSEWYAAYPDTKLINMFGITETTVHVTFKQLKQREILSGMSNIGKPIPTLKTYIIDRNLKLLPIGVPGECCVGGDGVARGYLNRPLLTKEKFIENPYIPGERWYKSGDLIRLLTSGDMEYLGRIDHQVKIRGFRIELGEIENQLLNHEGIKRAVVLLKGDRLFAYITAEKSFNASQLREYLSRRLPDYMIPSYFMQLGKIPLTSNGKVDHKALDSYGKRLTLDIPYSEPRNEIEKKIVGVWKEVLSLDKIGIHDNYFELGGTSFDIIRINKRLKDLFQIEVPVVTMFRYTTVHSFANNYLYKKTNEIRDREAVFKRGKRDKMERLQRRRGT